MIDRHCIVARTSIERVSQIAPPLEPSSMFCGEPSVSQNDGDCLDSLDEECTAVASVLRRGSTFLADCVLKAVDRRV